MTPSKRICRHTALKRVNGKLYALHPTKGWKYTGVDLSAKPGAGQ